MIQIHDADFALPTTSKTTPCARFALVEIVFRSFGNNAAQEKKTPKKEKVFTRSIFDP